MPKIWAKLKQGHSNGGAKCRWGRLNTGAVAENWRLSMRSIINLAWSQVYHTERPSYVFAARSPWCSTSRGFVSDRWSLLYLGLPETWYWTLSTTTATCRYLLPFGLLLQAVVMSSFRRSDPNSDFFHQKLNRIDSELIPQFFGGTEPKVKNQFHKTP